MLGVRFLFFLSLLLCLPLALAGGIFSQAQPAQEDQVKSGSPALHVCLRLEDQSPFLGAAAVRLVTDNGSEIAAQPGSDGIAVFPDINPGSYSIVVSSPGFSPVHQEIQVAAHGSLTHFVLMRPQHLELPEVPPVSQSPDLSSTKIQWTPPGVDDLIPPIDAHVECPLDDVLTGAQHRVRQFVGDLEKFSARERLEHHVVDALGNRRAPEVRGFNYVVTVGKSPAGIALMEEYRNGSLAPDVFPARIATKGMPAVVLVFDPQIMHDFSFSCEGLGRWQGKPAWQVHFSQRPDRPGRILAYSVDGKFVPVPLKGRAWVDLETLQVVRIETELVRPVPELGLTVEHIAISYHPVQFRSQGENLWLPREVELYVERQLHRYYRRHSYKEFRLFTVDTAQTFQLAKESYGFVNQSDRDITGVLTVMPVPGSKLDPVSMTFTIPPGGTVTKLVGPGKDVGIPVDAVASATFAHDGPQSSVRVDAHLSKGSTLDVVSGMPLPRH